MMCSSALTPVPERRGRLTVEISGTNPPPRTLSYRAAPARIWNWFFIRVILAIVWLHVAGTVVGADSVAELVRQLDAPDAKIRAAAAHGLGQLGQAAAPAVDALQKRLGDSESAVRAHAAQALGKIGKAARPAIEDLARHATDEDEHVRRAVMFAIAELKPDPKLAVPLALEALRDKETSVVVGAVYTLAEFGPPVVPAMIEALKDRRTAYYACLVLSELGPAAEPAVPALIKTLNSDEPEVRLEAALALGQIGAAAAPAVADLVQRLESEDEVDIQRAVAFALGKIGPAAKSALPALKKLHAEGDPQMRAVIVWSAAAIQPDDAEVRLRALKFLMNALQNADHNVRLAAAQGLLDLKPEPAEVLAKAKEIIRSSNEETIADILDTLASLGKEAVPALAEALQYPQVRLQAARIIGRVGPEASPAAPALIAVLADEDPKVRAEILFALASIGPTASDAVVQAASAMKDADPQVRFAGVYALGRFGPASAAAVPQLLEGLGDEDRYYATVCAWAVVRIDPNSDDNVNKALPLLIAALSHREAFMRAEAATTLGDLGDQARPALEALQRATSDADEVVRQAADAAIKKIRGKQNE